MTIGIKTVDLRSDVIDAQSREEAIENRLEEIADELESDGMVVTQISPIPEADLLLLFVENEEELEQYNQAQQMQNPIQQAFEEMMAGGADMNDGTNIPFE